MISTDVYKLKLTAIRIGVGILPLCDISISWLGTVAVPNICKINIF